jgi:hypothetical protein
MQSERPGSIGVLKKNQSIEINVSGNLGKNGGFGNSGRNTSMNQEVYHTKDYITK